VRRIVLVVALGIVASWLAPASSAVAAPLDGRIVYSDIFGESGIYTISPDGTDREHLVDGPGVYRPRWFSDGSGISFVAEVGPNGRKSRLEAIDVDGSDRRVLIGTKELPDGYDSISSYAWSPNGSELVLSLYGDGQGIFVASADGTSITRIVGNAGSPDWSSQDRIVATRNGRLITFDPDGGNLVKLAVGARSLDPNWSPDGSQIAFMCGKFARADVCVANADGTGVVDLTNSHEVDWSPSWSPDGSRIIWALSRAVSSFGNLRRMRADGSATARITSTKQIDEYEPDWIVLA
jgi:Tol biopolymer transport system component